MKKIFLFLVTFCLMLVFCSGCNWAKVESANETSESVSRFMLLENAGYWRVYADRYTHVMYVCSYGSYNIGNFTALVDTEGNPLIWDGEKEDLR